MLDTITFNTDRMAASADSPYAAATDLAEYLVRGGMLFRDAHAVVGAIVRRSMDEGVELAPLVEAEPTLGPEAAALMRPGVPVRMRTTAGGAGPVPVETQLVAARVRLADDRSRAGSLTR